MSDRETLEWENGEARVYREGRDGAEARDATPLEVEQYRENEQLRTWADGLVMETQRLQGIEEQNERLRAELEQARATAEQALGVLQAPLASGSTHAARRILSRHQKSTSKAPETRIREALIHLAPLMTDKARAFLENPHLADLHCRKDAREWSTSVTFLWKVVQALKGAPTE